MKKIIFNKIIIKNFLSIGKEPIEIQFKKGLHIITGINYDKEDSRNGVGKSAVADAIKYVLFGETLRPLKKEDVVNKITKKDCYVSLDFDIIDNTTTNYILTRTLIPSHIYLKKNGEDISRTIPKTTNLIENIISTTPEMLENSVIMSINNTEPFLAQKGVAKRKFIEEIFKLSIFSNMLKVIKDDLTNVKRDYDLEKTKIDEIQQNLIIYKQQQKEQQEKLKIDVKELENRINNNKQEIKKCENNLIIINEDNERDILTNVKLLKTEQDSCEVKIRKLVEVIANEQAETRNTQTKIRDIKNLGEICSECRRPYLEVDLKQRTKDIENYEQGIQHLLLQINNLNTQIKDTESIKTKCIQKIQKLIDEKQQIELQKKENENIQFKIKQYSVWNKQLLFDIEKYKNETDTFFTLIKEAETRLNVLNKELEAIIKKIKIFDIGKFITSEEGVKSFIVKKMLKLLNNKLNYYLAALNTNCTCAFDEYFEEKIINERGQPCSYFNFSGGERKRIDLSMLFTFRDIRRLQSTTSINFSMYDELLDSSLDAKGIEDVLEVLKKHVEEHGEAIYVISHKNEAIKHATGDIIFLEKRNGITQKGKYGTEI